MTIEFWKRYEGQVINDSYPLRQWIGGTSHGATYFTEYGEDLQPAVIKLIPADRVGSDSQLATWEAISRLSHVNLIRIFIAGQWEMDVRLLYVIMERADDNLADVLKERSLTAAETREMLEPALDALRYIHEHGFVHAGIKPSNILACGDRLKLASDGIMRVGEANPGQRDGGVNPPEWKEGVISPAGDVWLIAVAVVEALTRRAPNLENVWKSSFAVSLPHPFSDIVRNCLQRNPHDRWTVPQIASRLREPLVPPEGSAPVSPEYRHVRKRMLYAFVGLALAIIVAIALLFRKQSHSPDITTSVVPHSQTTRAVEKPKQGAEDAKVREMNDRLRATTPSIATPPPRIRGGPSVQMWYVVVATYAGRGGAAKRVREIARTWPNFKPTVYAPPIEKPHYLVVIGEKLSEKAALALQKQARAAGLPQDTYIKKFPGKPNQ